MSEGLRSKYFINGQITGQKLGEFEYFNVGDVTFNQLAADNITPTVKDSRYANKKPDRLIVRRRNRSTPEVLAVIEDKDTGLFGSDQERRKAIQQCNNYCQEVRACLGIVTDGNETIWINPRQHSSDNTYTDENTLVERSYTRIKKEDGSDVNVDFAFPDRGDASEVSTMSDELRKIYKLIKTIADVVNEQNSSIKEPDRIDPLPLAKSVWQAIWVATGKTPEKCLYNVVEIFIFKFLSDLGILNSTYCFDFLYGLVEKKEPAEDILRHYVKNSRDEICRKFPKEKDGDGTTIINGTIFVDEAGEPNTTQAILFVDTLKKFKAFEQEQGKFSTHNIDKDFKTKLYEQFLKQTTGLKALGQYFTPRKVVRAVVNMSDIKDFHNGERVCDPFCGVGGFILEPLNLPSRANDFKPTNNKIDPPITYVGYDKGFEKDEERTIILAKANMLIYIAELVAENKDIPQEFAHEAFNKTFTLWRSNLGTLGKVEKEESKKFDLILTNPPYVKKGKKALESEIQSNSELKSFYSVNAAGVEGLSIEWIVKHLKRGGRAFIIAPDGVLHRNEDKKLRKFLLDECYLDAIVSLPARTFYATPKKTYILVITKKDSREDVQTTPVFTYLVSNIGETLDINRFERPDKNDLEDMVSLFRQFDGAKGLANLSERLETQSKRCKVQTLELFDPSHHWLVDRLWTQEEKVALGIEETEELLTYDEFLDRLRDAQSFFRGKVFESSSRELEVAPKQQYKEVYLEEIIDIIRGSSDYTLKYVNDHHGLYPLYSAKTEDGGLMGNINSYQFDEECVTYTTNGVHAGTVFYREKHKFSLNGDAAMLRLKPQYAQYISYKYLAIAVGQAFKVEGLGWEYKASNGKVNQVLVRIPIKANGDYDFETQVTLAEKQETIKRLQRELTDQLALVSDAKVSIGD